MFYLKKNKIRYNFNINFHNLGNTMQLIKFLFGIILAQIATVSLVFLTGDELNTQSIIKLAIPILFISLIIAFWFTSITKYHTKEIIIRWNNFAHEREKVKNKCGKRQNGGG